MAPAAAITRVVTGIDPVGPVAKSSAGESKELRRVFAEHGVLLARREKRAIALDVVEALSIGAEALDVRHVGTPNQLRGAEQIAQVADELLGLRIGIVPHAAPGDRKHDLEQEIVAPVGR